MDLKRKIPTHQLVGGFLLLLALRPLVFAFLGPPIRRGEILPIVFESGIFALVAFLCFAVGQLELPTWVSRLTKIVATTIVITLVLAVGITAIMLPSYVQQKARLAADQDTLQAMRSAIANYYGRHGTFPDHPGNDINPTPPAFQCVNLAYSYGPITGELRITSTNSFRDCR